MAGIYIHIPFCKRKCTYCDFYKVVAPDLMDEYLQVLLQEIVLKKDYLGEATISSIYLGGGTPSLLKIDDLEKVLSKIFDTFTVNHDCEITLEANPDDLTQDYLSLLKKSSVNRLSIGIQSFNDNDLKIINRRHTGQQAKNAVIQARKSGFNNISIDLIYGIPGQTLEMWEEQLNQALELDVEHISAYGLTYEEGTALWSQRSKGKIRETEDEVMIKMHELMLLKFSNKAYEAYEISNFAKSGFRSRHNSAYWKFIPYLGLGPSAHSFDGHSRQWNVSSIKKYFSMIQQGEEYEAIEILSPRDFYNDQVMVSLRTSDGIDLIKLENDFGVETFQYCLKNAEKYIAQCFMVIQNEKLKLTQEGIRIANIIIADLMLTD